MKQFKCGRCRRLSDGRGAGTARYTGKMRRMCTACMLLLRHRLHAADPMPKPSLTKGITRTVGVALGYDDRIEMSPEEAARFVGEFGAAGPGRYVAAAGCCAARAVR